MAGRYVSLFVPASSHSHSMSDSRNRPSFLPTRDAELGLYHDSPTTAALTAQYGESYEARISTLKSGSPDIRVSESARPSPFSFRSSVSLIPTPGAVSKRHPNYVRHRLLLPIESPGAFVDSLIHGFGLHRNRSSCAFGL